MALPSYATGTATVVAGGTNVALLDATTAFNNVFAGDTFCIGTASAKVIEIVDDENFTITPWPGSDETGSSYVVYQDSKLRFTDVEIAIDLKKQVQALNTEGFYVFVPSSATEPDPSLGDDGQYAFQAATGKLWAKDSGAWVFLGVYKGFGLPAAYDGGKTYSLFDTATQDGSTYVWINETPGSGLAPPNATYWNVLAGKGEPGDAGPSPWTGPAAWVTGTGYVVGPPASAVTEDGETYVCLIQHTSGTFATDLAAGKWIKIAGKGADGLGVPAGGTAGQVLAKASGTDNDTHWIDPAGDPATAIHAATSKATPVNADEFALVDSAASNVLKKLTWANLKAALSSTFLTPSQARERLTADRIYYVDGVNGSDTNNGLASGTGHAFKKATFALALIASTLDPAGFKVTVQLADATYTDPIVLPNVVGFAKTGDLVIQGNNATPANVVVNVSSTYAILADGISTVWDIKDLKIQCTGYGISARSGAKARFGNVNFAACAAGHIQAFGPGSVVTALSNYAVSGGGNCHFECFYGSQFVSPTFTVTITNTPAFAIAWANLNVLGSAQVHSMTFSGSATGSRFAISNGAVLFTNGSTPSTYLPGNAAGTGTNFATSPYGLYA